MRKTNLNTLYLSSRQSSNEIDYVPELVLLLDSNDLREVVFNDERGEDCYCYKLDEHGFMCLADRVLEEGDFDELYNERGDEPEYSMFETYEDDEPQAFVPADWDNHEHYKLYESEHGINRTEYTFSEEDYLLSGVCYEADDHVLQDYPHTLQTFYKFVTDDGEEIYIKEVYPFYIDEHDYAFEVITKEEFEAHDSGNIYE